MRAPPLPVVVAVFALLRRLSVDPQPCGHAVSGLSERSAPPGAALPPEAGNFAPLTTPGFSGPGTGHQLITGPAASDAQRVPHLGRLAASDVHSNHPALSPPPGAAPPVPGLQDPASLRGSAGTPDLNAVSPSTGPQSWNQGSPSRPRTCRSRIPPTSRCGPCHSAPPRHASCTLTSFAQRSSRDSDAALPHTLNTRDGTAGAPRGPTAAFELACQARCPRKGNSGGLC